ncbi:hypothetical protein ACHAXS_013372, partial [Conticribra weissflogii]
DEGEINSDDDYKNYENHDDQESVSDDDDDDDDDDDGLAFETTRSNGMANAMTRILGMSAPTQSSSASSTTKKSSENKSDKPTSTAPVILSKTITPLQKLQQKLKNEERSLRQKRQNRRMENLSAMRLPLAPSAGMSAEKLWKLKKMSESKIGRRQDEKKRKREDGDDEEEDEDDTDGKRNNEVDANAMAIANEIEAERSHRRIATRGVVALFNAISKHRQTVQAEEARREEERIRLREEGRAMKKSKMNGQGGEGDSSGKTTTKHGFLDMIKKSAMGAAGGGSNANATAASADAASEKDKDISNKTKDEGKNEQSGKSSSGAVGWSALKDDFMMNSKLKDWDKEISDDDDDDDDDDAAPMDSKMKGQKRQKV